MTADSADSAAASKPQQRKEMAALRDAIPAQERAALSEQLCRRVWQELILPMRVKLGRPLTICVYGAFRSEADPQLLARLCLEAGDTVAAPRVTGKDMEWRVISSPEDWQPGAWGVPEPDLARTEPLPVRAVPDAVLVPGLAFHPDGSRLGYGGGYYDRMYAAETAKGRTSICWIGFAFAQQISEKPLPKEPHDLILNVLATEEQLIWLKDGRQAESGT